jgi:broad specificity phosphatase PhoE
MNVVQEIVEKEEGKTVAIVTHATPIRTLMCRIKGFGMERLKEISWVSNASVSVVSVDGDWVLTQESFDLHLAELKTQFPANV